MALPATKEQQFSQQLAAAQVKKRTDDRRKGQVLSFPTGRPIGTDAASAREAELGAGERFQAEQARRSADASVSNNLGMQLLVDQGVLSQSTFEQSAQEAKQAVQQLRAAATIQQALAARANLNKVREKIGGIELSEKQKEQFDEFREIIWREVRIGGPILDDFAMGWTLGLGTLLSYVIWIWQALKGFKYRNEPEPLSVVALLSPPPMPLSVVGKGTMQMMKMIVTKLIDALGILWNNMNLALVVVCIGISVVFILFFNCTINPFTPDAFSGICDEFLKVVGAVAAD